MSLIPNRIIITYFVFLWPIKALFLYLIFQIFGTYYLLQFEISTPNKVNSKVKTVTESRFKFKFIALPQS